MPLYEDILRKFWLGVYGMKLKATFTHLLQCADRVKSISYDKVDQKKSFGWRNKIEGAKVLRVITVCVCYTGFFLVVQRQLRIHNRTYEWMIDTQTTYTACFRKREAFENVEQWK